MIYCVEDERNIRDLIVYTLKSAGYDAVGFEDGKEFFGGLKGDVRLILLDIMLPGDDGLTILKKLKEDLRYRDIPVIMLTAKDSEYDKVTGLNLGADDYIAKPFGMMEFLARVGAVLRRSGQTKAEKEKDDVLKYKDLELYKSRHKVIASGKQVELTLKEFGLLEYLLENKTIVLTRDMLLSKVWGYDFDGESRTVDVHVRTLRQKIGSCGDYIETVRGVGYRIGGRES